MAAPFDRSVAPAEHGEAFLADDALDDAFALQALLRLHRQEHHADAVFACRRQREARACAHSRAKNLCGIWIRTPAPSPVSGIAAASAAMRQIDQNLNALDDDVVRFVTVDVGNEADAAGIVLIAGVVETLACRESVGLAVVVHVASSGRYTEV